ncbi:E3 ubiquitin-protein ligase lubel isoform X2 [Eucyclogobius newberryi]|uniref:E3 ubiquitin-protein ligase lubel isoform X2 n=1 Tax=Eucyclogobius newberryi TaxID=166745 RepID=UPI003B5CD286
MFRVGGDAERRVLAELQYSDSELVQEELKQVRAVFSDLRLYCDIYCFPNKQKRRLLFLAGTIPVSYQGSRYNFPVCLWLHHTHPAARPRCCLCPSVSMAINPHCCYVDAHGNILLSRLHTWTQGQSTLVLLLSEMTQAFEKDTPLYSRPLPPPQTLPSAGGGRSGSGPGLSPGSLKGPVKRSYCDDLKDIDFSPAHKNHSPTHSSPAHSESEELLQAMSAFTLQTNQSELRQSRKPLLLPTSEEHKAISLLPPHKLQMFLQLQQSIGRGYSAEGRGYSAEGRSYSTGELLEAVRLNEDLASVQRFLNHLCPVCQEQVSFSKMVLMTHCCCSLCESCFKSWFSSVIREKSVEQFVCPLCGKPDFRDQPDLDMDYFNLLDTQVKHFLSEELHELFQRKLRDRALIHMKHFCWCSHCSFGVVHESGSLKMDCPSCNKSTCSRCRSPWSPEHEGISCEDFRVRTKTKTGLYFNCIECPDCGELYSGSRGGCLHFSCLRCGTQFCGGCSRRFVHGQDCVFSVSCSLRGLHAHHPRDCIYHLRDWSVSRLHLLLQFYRGSPIWIEEANLSAGPALPSGMCPVTEVRGHCEEPCGKAAPPGVYRGYCRSHYLERLVDLLKVLGADPVVVFSVEELETELRRWNQPVPPRPDPRPDPPPDPPPDTAEPELQHHAHLTRMVLQNLPLKTRTGPGAAVWTSVSAPPQPGLDQD